MARAAPAAEDGMLMVAGEMAHAAAAAAEDGTVMAAETCPYPCPCPCHYPCPYPCLCPCPDPCHYPCPCHYRQLAQPVRGVRGLGGAGEPISQPPPLLWWSSWPVCFLRCCMACLFILVDALLATGAWSMSTLTRPSWRNRAREVSMFPAPAGKEMHLCLGCAISHWTCSSRVIAI
jgi:hypothetical protein